MRQSLAPLCRPHGSPSVRSFTRQEALLRRLTSMITRGLVLPFVLFGLVATAPLAHAGVVTDHSGTFCKNSSPSDVSYIEYQPFGTRNTKGTSTQITCPLSRSTINSNGATVYVDIYHTGVQTTSCLFASYNVSGTAYGSAGDTWTGSGPHEFSLSLPSGYSDPWSNYVVVCTIPGNSNGAVLSMDLVEN